ncbi:MAG: hypothetical protein JWQ39_3027, partial [Glaciihabitans sp.]|nr:hypothetical protein [Glaciihabitans sp.]
MTFRASRLVLAIAGAILGIGLAIGGFATAANADPNVSITVNSVSRDASTGEFNYDITVVASEAATSCGYYCTVVLTANQAAGGSPTLGSVNLYPDSSGLVDSTNHEFTGSLRATHITSLSANTHDYSYDNLSSTTHSITDSYPTPSISLAVSSVNRLSDTGALTWDATATLSNYALPDGECSGPYGCTVYLIGTHADGSTQDLDSHSVDGSTYARYPATVHFDNTATGGTRTNKIVSLKSYVQGYASTTQLASSSISVTDPYPTPSVSLSVASVNRIPGTGNLTWDATATLNNYALTDGECVSNYYCTAYLQGVLADGTKETLDSESVPGGIYATYPYSVHFDYTATSGRRTQQIFGLQVYVQGYLSSTSLTSPVVTVTDPYPTPAISLTVGSISRDSAGNLNYDATATVDNYALPGGKCDYNYGCTLSLQATYADGSKSVINSTTIAGGLYATYPTTYEFQGAGVRSAQVVSFSVNLHQLYGATGDPWSSSEVSVIDPYPTPAIQITVKSIKRNPTTGAIDFQVYTRSSYWENATDACTYTCLLTLYQIQRSGAVESAGEITLPAASTISYPYGYTFSNSTTSSADVVGFRAEIRNYWTSQLPPKIVSPTVPFTQGPILPGEFAGGGNASELGCGCTAGDPVNLSTGEFYESVTDDVIPGTGPPLEVARTYSTNSAASDGPFGYGWSPNFATHLEVVTPGDTSDPLPRKVRITQENGATVEFEENSDHMYEAGARVLASLTYDATADQWTFTRHASDTLTFDTDGNLLTRTDLNGNTVTNHYTSGVLTSISASGGRSISFSWSGSHISATTDSAGRATLYTYDTAGNLLTATAVDGAVTTYTYDTNHRMTTMTKPKGGTTTNVYDSSGRVVSQTDPVGGETTFAYDDGTTTTTAPDGSVSVQVYDQGLLVSQTRDFGTLNAATTTHTYTVEGAIASTSDPLGKTTSFTYDDAGNRLTATDQLGHTTTSTYDSSNDLLTVTDPLGRVTTNTYDSAGNRLTSTSPSGRVQHWTYNSDGTVANSEDPRGKTTTYAYDTAGDLTSTTDPDGRVTSATYNSAGFPTTSTDGAGKTTTLTVDAVGRVLTSTDPNGHVTTNAYDPDGNLTSTEDAASHTSSSVYDNADQLTSSTDARGKTTTYTYTSTGQLHTVTNPDSHVTTNNYNKLGELTSVEDANGHITTFGYDADGRKTSTELPSGDESHVAYDDAGRVTSSTDARGKTTTTTYDADGEPTSVTDPMGRPTSTSYTANRQVDTTTLPDSSTESYTYNADGQTTQFTNADGKNTAYSYDDAGLLTSKTEPGGIETGYTYDSAGRLHVTTNSDGTTLTDSYDDAGQLTRVHSSVYGSTDITFTYTSTGQRATMTDQTGVTTYSHDADNAITGVTNGAGNHVGYAHDNAGLTTSMTYPGSHTVNYTYDFVGQMASITDWSGNETDFTWTADGQLHTQADPNGVTETRTYNADDQTTEIADVKSGSTLGDYSYGYDNAGDISSDTSADSTGTATHGYAYDANTQLATVTSGGTSHTYTASSAGELTSDTTGQTLAYNGAQELISLTPTSGPATSYSYDDNGSRTSSSISSATTSYSYDPEGDLASAVVPAASSTTIDYTSDGDGLRQSRTIGSTTTHYLWDTSGGLPLLLDDG